MRSQTKLQKKCKLLLARRDWPASIWFYIKYDLRRQFIFLVCYVGVSAALWLVDLDLLAIALLAFYFGRVARDFRWWNVLAKEWPTTKELLDWQKIESIAADNGDG